MAPASGPALARSVVSVVGRVVHYFGECMLWLRGVRQSRLWGHRCRSGQSVPILGGLRKKSRRLRCIARDSIERSHVSDAVVDSFLASLGPSIATPRRGPPFCGHRERKAPSAELWTAASGSRSTTACRTLPPPQARCEEGAHGEGTGGRRRRPASTVDTDRWNAGDGSRQKGCQQGGREGRRE